MGTNANIDYSHVDWPPDTVMSYCQLRITEAVLLLKEKQNSSSIVGGVNRWTLEKSNSTWEMRGASIFLLFSALPLEGLLFTLILSGNHVCNLIKMVSDEAFSLCGRKGSGQTAMQASILCHNHTPDGLLIVLPCAELVTGVSSGCLRDVESLFKLFVDC